MRPAQPILSQHEPCHPSILPCVVIASAEQISLTKSRSNICSMQVEDRAAVACRRLGGCESARRACEQESDHPGDEAQPDVVLTATVIGAQW